MLSKGHQVIVLVRWQPQMPARQSVEDALVLRLPKYPNRYVLRIWLFLHAKELAGTDVVHSHDLYLPQLGKTFPEAKFVHTFHGYEGFPIKPEAQKIRQQIRRQVPHCVCVGAYVEKWYGTPCDLVIYGAATPIKPVTEKTSFGAVFLGRLETDTGFWTYLEAVQTISKQSADFSMLVIGDGSLMEPAKKFARTNELNVEFRGALQKASSYLPLAKIAFVSGYLAMIEAGSLGLPIVAYYGTPIKKDYLECHPMAANMYLADSSETIAKQYFAAKNDGGKRAKKMQTWARQQTWEKLAESYEKIYEERA